MGTIKLNRLSFKAKHGFYDYEREEGNHFEVDLEFTYPLLPSAQNDDLEKTLDYEAAQNIVKSVMEGPSCKLIETLTYAIGQKLFNHFSALRSLTVTVRKLNPPMDISCESAETTLSWPLSSSA